MASWEVLIKPTLDLLRSGLRLAKREGAKRRNEKLLSEIVRELLKGAPDFDLLEAHWGRLKKMDVLPTGTYVRARRLYRNAVARREVRAVAGPGEGKKAVGKRPDKRSTKRKKESKSR